MAFFKNIKNVLLGVDESDDEFEGDEIEDTFEEAKRKDRSVAEVTSMVDRRPIRPKVVSMEDHLTRTSTSGQVLVCTPSNIEDAREVIHNTKSGVISVVDLDGVDPALAQRVADFLSGSVDALDGTIRRLSDAMFLVAPFGVSVGPNAEIEQTLRKKNVFFK